MASIASVPTASWKPVLSNFTVKCPAAALSKGALWLTRSGRAQGSRCNIYANEPSSSSVITQWQPRGCPVAARAKLAHRPSPCPSSSTSPTASPRPFFAGGDTSLPHGMGAWNELGGRGERSSKRRPEGKGGGGGARAPMNFHNETIPSSCPALAYSSLISFSSFNMFSMIVVAHKLVFA